VACASDVAEPGAVRRMNRHSVSLRYKNVARRVLAVLVVLGAWLAFAAGVDAQAHAIGPGNEARVLALFAPYTLGGEVAAGHRLWGVSIERTRVHITLRAADGSEATLALQHPDDTLRSDARTESFAVVFGPEPGSAAMAARRALVTAITRHDAGNFWSETAGTTTEASSPIGDGLLQIAFLALLSLFLAGRLLARESRWLAGGLVAVVVAGVLVRLALSPQTFLGAWPWSRLYPHARAVAEGPWLTALTEHFGRTVYLTDVMLWTSFAYAVLMPIALFAHATYLLKDARAGLAAAFAVAFLPQHIRFSISEDGFVGSLLLTSLAFALIHGFLRDRARAVRWLLLLALPAVLYPGYLLRPLNILFIVSTRQRSSRCTARARPDCVAESRSPWCSPSERLRSCASPRSTSRPSRRSRRSRGS